MFSGFPMPDGHLYDPQPLRTPLARPPPLPAPVVLLHGRISPLFDLVFGISARFSPGRVGATVSKPSVGCGTE